MLVLVSASCKVCCSNFMLIQKKNTSSARCLEIAQVQAAGPRYIRGRRTIYSYFTSNANRCWSGSGRIFALPLPLPQQNDRFHLFQLPRPHPWLWVCRRNSRHAAWPTVILRFMETRWKTLALPRRNLIRWKNSITFLTNFDRIDHIPEIDSTLNAYHNLLETPLDLEALDLSLHSLLVNPALLVTIP